MLPHMNKGKKIIIKIMAIFTITMQMGGILLPHFATEVKAVAQVQQETVGGIQPETVEEVQAESTEENLKKTEEITRNYEIKDEETWDISKNGDGSVIANWTLSDRALKISGTGEMKNWEYNEEGLWRNTQYEGIINNVIIEEGITNIGEYAFSGCSNLTNIHIPDSVTSIGNNAFFGCSRLESIEIPEGVTSIEYGAFYRCSSLESIEIPEGVTNIGNYAFDYCNKLIIYAKANSEAHRYVEEIGKGYRLSYVHGDINQDAHIDITDILLLKRHLVAKNKTEWILGGKGLELADMNTDESVDITDLFMLKKVVVQNI